MKPDPDSTTPEPAETPSPRRRRWPRPETLLLVLGLLWTVGAKYGALRGHDPGNMAVALLKVGLTDVVFFGLVLTLLPLLYLSRFHGLAGRVSMVVGGVVLAWSVLNSGWLLATDVQLHPGVLSVLSRNPMEFAPVVVHHVKVRPYYSIPLGITLVLALAWFVFRCIKPVPYAHDCGGTLRRAAVPASTVVVALLVMLVLPAMAGLTYARETLGFSSHWHAITRSMLSRHSDDGPARDIVRAGQRTITPPANDTDLPNVVIVFLESISYESTSLSDASATSTPVLERLAAEGTEMVTTRAPVSQTSKAFWAVFTGTDPEVRHSATESALADEPYESLATILGTAGYRSAFFEMSKGSFENAPGIFWNLGFDWAWFRENLADPSSHIGYMNGDDERLLDPALDWAQAEPGPFMLTMITTIAHDPHTVPSYFETPADTYRERFEQSIRYTDWFLGELLDRLTARGLDDNLLLCVIGDHGLEFAQDKPRSARWTPKEELIRVPWIIRWPGQVEAGRRVEIPGSQLDVAPTLLALLGFGVDDAGFDGVNALAADDTSRRVYFSSWYDDAPRGFVEGSRKVMHWPVMGTLYEYDLDADPGEESGREIDGAARDAIISDIEQWRSRTHFRIPAGRFRERFVYDHWQTFSSGEKAWAYYLP